MASAAPRRSPHVERDRPGHQDGAATFRGAASDDQGGDSDSFYSGIHSNRRVGKRYPVLESDGQYDHVVAAFVDRQERVGPEPSRQRQGSYGRSRRTPENYRYGLWHV